MIIEKDDFIKLITSMTKEEINDYIKEKGKKPKLIAPVIKLNDTGKILLR